MLKELLKMPRLRTSFQLILTKVVITLDNCLKEYSNYIYTTIPYNRDWQKLHYTHFILFYFIWPSHQHYKEEFYIPIPHCASSHCDIEHSRPSSLPRHAMQIPLCDFLASMLCSKFLCSFSLLLLLLEKTFTFFTQTECKLTEHWK